jgi:hypothetical protein
MNFYNLSHFLLWFRCKFRNQLDICIIKKYIQIHMTWYCQWKSSYPIGVSVTQLVKKRWASVEECGSIPTKLILGEGRRTLSCELSIWVKIRAVKESHIGGGMTWTWVISRDRSHLISRFCRVELGPSQFLTTDA